MWLILNLFCFGFLLPPFTRWQSHCLLRAKSIRVGTSAEERFAVERGTHSQLAALPCLLCAALGFQASSVTVPAPPCAHPSAAMPDLLCSWSRAVPLSPAMSTR